MNTVLIVVTLAEVLLLVLVLAGFLLAITARLQRIASTVGLIRIGVHAIDEQLRPIDPEVRGINGALEKVANALANVTGVR
jgi:hypothetical protein